MIPVDDASVFKNPIDKCVEIFPKNLVFPGWPCIAPALAMLLVYKSLVMQLELMAPALIYCVGEIVGALPFQNSGTFVSPCGHLDRKLFRCLGTGGGFQGLHARMLLQTLLPVHVF